MRFGLYRNESLNPFSAVVVNWSYVADNLQCLKFVSENLFEPLCLLSALYCWDIANQGGHSFLKCCKYLVRQTSRVLLIRFSPPLHSLKHLVTVAGSKIAKCVGCGLCVGRIFHVLGDKLFEPFVVEDPACGSYPLEASAI